MEGITQFLTFNLKLREPSRHKAAMIFRAMRKATAARVAIMEEWEHHPDVLSAITGKIDKRATKILASELVRTANGKHPIAGPLGSLRDGVVQDCASMLKSRLRLLAEHDEMAGAADLIPREDGFERGLSLLASSTTLIQQNEARDLMAQKARDDLRPLNFPRFRGNDGFMLLEDVDGRIFAALPLADKSSYRHDKCNNERDLFDFRTGAQCKPVGKAILYPIDCGEWQLRQLRTATPKTAKLSYKRGDFVLHVTAEMPVTVKPMTDQRIVGVDRGIDEIASIVVRDSTGKVVESAHVEGETLRSLQRKAENRARHAQRVGRNVKPIRVKFAADVIVHETSRQIVDMAARHDAFIALEELSAISNGPHRRRKNGSPRSAKALNRQLSRAQYAKLEGQIRYKSKLAGLVDGYGREAVLTINGAWTSQMCAECGHTSRDNRPSRSEFKCVACGHTAHADANAACNIAGKGFVALSRMSETAAKKGRTLLLASQLEDAPTTAPAAIRSSGAKSQPSAREKPMDSSVVAAPASAKFDTSTQLNVVLHQSPEQ